MTRACMALGALLILAGCGNERAPAPTDPAVKSEPVGCAHERLNVPLLRHHALRKQATTRPDGLKYTQNRVLSVKQDGENTLFVLAEKEWKDPFTRHYPLYTIRTCDLATDGTHITLKPKDFVRVAWYEQDGTRIAWDVQVLQR